MGNDTLILFDEAMVLHDMGAGHPERPERLRAVVDRLRDEHPLPGTRWEKPRLAPRAALERVHDLSYLDRLDGLRGYAARLDPDTSTSPGSIEAMYLAAGAAIDAVTAVVRGDASNALALVRPPGHHAEAGRARGFCLVNNVAVAAEYARAELGCERVLIVDWDVHHGNGTQHSFEDRADVLYFSTHRFPFFPGTGWLEEIGTGDGLGYTVNVPLPAFLGDPELGTAFREILVPVADGFRPDLVLVSAGFDAHRDDPLGGMQVSEEGFAALCGVVQDIATRHAGGRLALLLEGGYGLEGLAASVHACTQVLTGATPPPTAAATDPRFGELLAAIRDALAGRWSF